MAKWSMTPVSPTSIGIALPDRVVSNADLCEILDTTPDWIEAKTGIRERRFLGTGQSTTDLAVSAADKALRSAGIRPQEIDVLVVASSTPDWIFPSLSVTVAHTLGMTTTRVVDITQQACSSSIYATYTAACLLQEEGLNSALVVCAEGASRAMDPGDRTTRIFFGDAAGAMIIQKVESEGLLAYDLGNHYSEAVSMAGPSLLRSERDSVGRELHNLYFQMDGRTVQREATSRFPDSIRASLLSADVDPVDVDGFALHQANVRLLEHITRKLDVESSRVAITADLFGNTGAASPLTALWKLAREGRAKRGSVIVLAAIGAGFLWGSLCFRLSDDIYVEE